MLVLSKNSNFSLPFERDEYSVVDKRKSLGLNYFLIFNHLTMLLIHWIEKFIELSWNCCIIVWMKNLLLKYIWLRFCCRSSLITLQGSPFWVAQPFYIISQAFNKHCLSDYPKAFSLLSIRYLWKVLLMKTLNINIKYLSLIKDYDRKFIPLFSCPLSMLCGVGRANDCIFPWWV